jgi:class 3 adenylate cyclase
LTIRDGFFERLSIIRERTTSLSTANVLPSQENTLLASGKKTRGVVLFADISRSTVLAAKYGSKAESMLFTLDLVIPTLMDVARYYRGNFEKNTGDGILSYFGVESSDEDAVSLAYDAACGMMEAVRDLVNPVLSDASLVPIKITVGADLGDFIVARIGLARDANPMVAVGAVANRAAKIQGSCVAGEFRVGEEFWRVSQPALRRRFQSAPPPRPWPFTVPKTAAELATERDAARMAEEQRRRELEGRLGSVNIPGLFAESFPLTISPTRPYRVYAYRDKW